MNSFAFKREPLRDTPATSYSSTTFNIERIPSKYNGYQLAITGFLAPGWTGRLTAGLAQQRIGIVRGEAERTSASNWRSSFELKAAPFAKDPAGIDYAALAALEVGGDRKTNRIELLDFTLEPPSRHNGSLYIEVKGVDRLGFLGDLLDYFSMRCLFPVKMTIETVGEAAVDCFWLKGVGGAVPSDSITDSIRENLAQLVAASR